MVHIPKIANYLLQNILKELKEMVLKEVREGMIKISYQIEKITISKL